LSGVVIRVIGSRDEIEKLVIGKSVDDRLGIVMKLPIEVHDKMVKGSKVLEKIFYFSFF